MLNVTICLYDGFTALDAVGPYEVLTAAPDVRVSFAAREAGLVVADSRQLALYAPHALREIATTDVLLVPGGPGDAQAIADAAFLAELRRLAETATWVTSVCTGSLVLGAAGLLRGRRATTHWMRLERLHDYGATPVSERFVQDGNVITGAGVSAGIDMALQLVGTQFGRTVAEAVQLGIEYAPRPPFAAGTPETAPTLVRAGVQLGFDRKLQQRLQSEPPPRIAEAMRRA